MKRVSELIKRSCPSYQDLSKDVYAYNYDNKWDKPMYKGNAVFEELKKKYGHQSLTRDMIINLFKQGKYFDGFLCAMVWGNMGTYMGGKKRFESVFDNSNKDKIDNVVALLKNGDIENAYTSLCNKEQNGIRGLGMSFFTKLLYFAGASINNLPFQPLIYDRIMDQRYTRILSIIGKNKPRGEYNRYKDYCKRMEELRKLLDLQSVGQVEALLFTHAI